MKRIICVFLFLLFLPCLCSAQSIFIDYSVTSDIDQSLFWVMTDANSVKYRGCNTIALGVDPNAYVEAHKAEWLQAIYEMNTDPNVPDWVDTHPGKYLAAMGLLDEINQMIAAATTLNDVKAILLKQSNLGRKMVKTIYPMRLNISD